MISPEALAGQCGAVQQCPGSLLCLFATPVVSRPWLHCSASQHGSLCLVWGQGSAGAQSASQAGGEQQPGQLLHSNPCCSPAALPACSTAPKAAGLKQGKGRLKFTSQVHITSVSADLCTCLCPLVLDSSNLCFLFLHLKVLIPG